MQRKVNAYFLVHYSVTDGTMTLLIDSMTLLIDCYLHALSWESRYQFLFPLANLAINFISP
jgi:hypothetical protein